VLLISNQQHLRQLSRQAHNKRQLYMFDKKQTFNRIDFDSVLHSMCSRNSGSLVNKKLQIEVNIMDTQKANELQNLGMVAADSGSGLPFPQRQSAYNSMSSGESRTKWQVLLWIV
jgi:hypothetical protein